MRRQQRSVATVLVLLLALGALWWVGSLGGAESTTDPSSRSAAPAPEPSELPTVDLADLPPEAAETVALIDAGGPYPFPDNDDGVFGNFEGLLPPQDRGFYREYTVPTPGLDHRGARRIVAGSDGTLYWTADHYESFERIQR